MLCKLTINFNIILFRQFVIIIKPGVVVGTSFLLDYLDLGIKDLLKDIPFFYALIGYMLFDDLLHYWFHRKGHEWQWLWRFHKTHHTTPTMNVGVAFRQSLYWFILMPNLYFGALAVYVGLGEAFLYWDGKEHQACGTEGGHTDFAPLIASDLDLWIFFKKRFPDHISYERLVSGPGIALLFDFLCESPNPIV